jgi:hypothetical protein
MTRTTIDQAVDFVKVAIERLPNLTVYGVGVPPSYHKLGPEAVAAEVLKRQEDLYTETSLISTARCADWLDANRWLVNSTESSYFFKHSVEAWRSEEGDEESYTRQGCFIAAAVGLGLPIKIVDGMNVTFVRSGCKPKTPRVRVARSTYGPKRPKRPFSMSRLSIARLRARLKPSA